MVKSHKTYYSMGQVCEMFDLPASTIRFWETRFTALRPKKNAKGNRLFSPEDVETLKLIYHLTKEKKMTLQGAQKFLMQKRVAAKGEMSLIEILQGIKTTLLEIRQELESNESLSAKDIIVKGEQVETIEPEVEIKEQTVAQQYTIDQITSSDIEAQAQMAIEQLQAELDQPDVPAKQKYTEPTLF
ncbi:MAG: MerR family transcriptional regulator [Mucinivorans sp.]